MARDFYSSDIDLFDSFFLFFFDLLYFLSFGLLDCQFILNLAKILLFFYVSSNGFDKTKTSVNRLEKVIDISTADGGAGSYQLQSLMVLHLMVMEFLLQTMVTSKGSMKFNGNLFDSVIINRVI